MALAAALLLQTGQSVSQLLRPINCPPRHLLVLQESVDNFCVSEVIEAVVQIKKKKSATKLTTEIDKFQKTLGHFLSLQVSVLLHSWGVGII